MSTLEFHPNSKPTLGVELEIQLVDPETLELKNCFLDVLEHVPEEFHGSIKPEIMQSYLEINTKVCDTVADVEDDLRKKVKAAEDAAACAGARLFWAATHPFSPWYEQLLTPDERYQRLCDNLQDTARRLVTFGLHVHVGVDSGDKAIMICDRILRHLPTLLSLSANSPFWSGRTTGLHSQRSKVMESLPTAGLPPMMRNWSEYVWLIRHLVETKFIETIREIWWDVRPHHNFGTVEVRICDMPSDLKTVLAITALIQCLVHALSEEIDEGTYQFDCHPLLVRQNKWRACRHGIEAALVDIHHKPQPARKVLKDLVGVLREYAQELHCEEYLQYAHECANGLGGSQKQIAIYERTGDLREVVKQFMAQHPCG
ncbi:MAG: YbdK family carboxylate-amine ligase [Gemmataceae bacterium]